MGRTQTFSQARSGGGGGGLGVELRTGDKEGFENIGVGHSDLLHLECETLRYGPSGSGSSHLGSSDLSSISAPR